MPLDMSHDLRHASCNADIFQKTLSAEYVDVNAGDFGERFGKQNISAEMLPSRSVELDCAGCNQFLYGPWCLRVSTIVDGCKVFAVCIIPVYRQRYQHATRLAYWYLGHTLTSTSEPSALPKICSAACHDLDIFEICIANLGASIPPEHRVDRLRELSAGFLVDAAGVNPA